MSKWKWNEDVDVNALFKVKHYPQMLISHTPNDPEMGIKSNTYFLIRLKISQSQVPKLTVHSGHYHLVIVDGFPMMSSPPLDSVPVVGRMSGVDDTRDRLVLHYSTPKTLCAHDTLWMLWPPPWCDMTALSATDIFAVLGPRLTVAFKCHPSRPGEGFCIGQGINWKLCTQLCEIAFKPRKIF